MPGPLIQIGAGVEWQIPVLPLTAREECSHCPQQQQWETICYVANVML